MTETPTPGLTHTRQGAVSAAARVEADQPPSELWAGLVESKGFERALVSGVRDLLAGAGQHNRAWKLREAGVVAGEGGYARFLVGLDRAPESEAYQRALAETARFGQGETAPFGKSPELGDLSEGPLAVLEAADVVPTVVIRFSQEFRERRRDQREQVCRLVATLAQACDVRVVATGLTARWLVETHGRQLPRSFSQQCKTGGQSDTEIEARVEAARERFDPEGRAVKFLRELSEEPAETLSYHGLAGRTQVSRGRVSQVLGELADAGLIEKYGPQSRRKIDLLPAGAEFLAWLDREMGRQQRLEDAFSETGQNPHSDVYTPPPGSPPPGGGPPEESEEPESHVPYRTRYADRSAHAGAAGAASAGDIVAVEGKLPEFDEEERHTRFVSYDDSREEAVVAVQASTPIQYITSVALGLASPRLLDEALPAERLNEIEDSAWVLRSVRCIGGLSEEAASSGERFREALIEWGEELAELTRKLHCEEYEDRSRLCGEILRVGQGLAGTMVHLLDAAGVDVVREVRVPRLGDGQAGKLGRTIAISASIQSQYGAFAAYRQLFESRERKREVPSPDVDASDPVGSLIGSVVIRGPEAERVGKHVEGHLREPVPLHEDAPEFAVGITVTRPGRAATTAAANRMLKAKGLRATPEAVSLLEGLTEDIHAVTTALKGLGKEERERTVRLDEVRYGLCQLRGERLLRGAVPSVSKAVKALLETREPVGKSELAEAAGISERSLRRHIGGLVGLDVVRETEEGYRIALPRPDEEERGERIVPEPVRGERRAQLVVFDLVLELIDEGEAGRLGDPTDGLGEAFFGPRLELGKIRRELRGAGPYLELGLSLCARPSWSGKRVEVGSELEQASLSEGRESGGEGEGGEREVWSDGGVE